MVLELLQDMLVNGHLIAAEHKNAVAIIKQLEKDECEENNQQLRLILNPTLVKQNILSFFFLRSFFLLSLRIPHLNRSLFLILLNK
jgi:hypothetical protein